MESGKTALSFRLTEQTRVGDLGILDEDGFVTVTGRIKDVILRGGASIAPLEIDAALMSHPDVHEAAVIGVPDRIWGEEIAAFLVGADNADLSQDDVLAHAATILPKFKRPKPSISSMRCRKITAEKSAGTILRRSGRWGEEELVGGPAVGNRNQRDPANNQHQAGCKVDRQRLVQKNDAEDQRENRRAK